MAILDKTRVLLVEDEEYVIDMYRQVLEKNGATVTVAENGQKGIAALNKDTFDIVILDRILNDDMNGIDVLKHMREQEETKNTPVLILTNLDLAPEEEDMVKSLRISGYYLKAEVSLDALSTILLEATNTKETGVEN